MAPKAKRRKIECLVCKRQFDSDYRRSHNERHHRNLVRSNKQIPFKDVCAVKNPFEAAARGQHVKANNGKSAPSLQFNLGPIPLNESPASPTNVPASESTNALSTSTLSSPVSNFNKLPTYDTAAADEQGINDVSRKVDYKALACREAFEDHLFVDSRENSQEKNLLVELGETCEGQSTGATMHGEEILDERLNGDPGLFVNKMLSPQQRNLLIFQGPNQPKQNELPGKEFPKTMSGSHNRGFSESWYFANIGKESCKRQWLSYSSVKDAIFCHHCIFFSKAQETTFTKLGFNDWKKAQEKLSKHEKSYSHINASIDFANYCYLKPITEKLSDEKKAQESLRQLQVRKNREVMKRLIDITTFLAKQGLAFRGHREENENGCHTPKKGNFLAIVDLLAKYDDALANHLTNVKEKRAKCNLKKKRKREKKSKRSGRGNLITYLSSDSQNRIINTVSAHILQVILEEIKISRYYSISMDSTTDRAKKDQLSIIIRYLNESSDIVERLIAVERVEDTSAKGIFKALTNVLEKNSINLADAVGQSYDGASVMSGKYSGVRALVQNVNPSCIYIWTLDHVLNLVIMDACQSSLAAKTLFGNLEKLYSFFSNSHKRSDILEKIQKDYQIENVHRPQRVSTTRWWSHQKSLNNVFFANSEKLFDCFMDTLQHCQSEGESSETVTDADALENKLCSFQVVLTAHVFRRIFGVTDPASNYLQSEKIDLLTAIRLIETVEEELAILRGQFSVILSEAQSYCKRHNIEEQDFPARRSRKRKCMSDEFCNDEIEENQTSKYKRETFIFAIDTALTAIRTRFSSHKAILRDFALLDPERFQDVIDSHSLPEDAFENAAKNYGLNVIALRDEYSSFVRVYKEMKGKAPLFNQVLEKNKDLARENFITALKFIKMHQIESAYPELHILYRILVTLPIGSTKCERTFSKLKMIKSSLRSTMAQERLSSLILLNVEFDLLQQINKEEIINDFASTPLLRRLLVD